MKSFFRGVGRVDVAGKIKRIKQDKTQPVPVAFDDVEKMANATECLRDKLIVKMLYSTGVRVSELLSIAVRDVNFNEGIVRVKGKGGKARLVCIDTQTLELLKQHLAGRTVGPIIRLSACTIRQRLKSLATTAGLENWNKITPHKLRHSFSINWVKHGGDIESLRRLLGHESLEVTRVYLDFDFDHVKKTYSRIFGDASQPSTPKTWRSKVEEDVVPP